MSERNVSRSKVQAIFRWFEGTDHQGLTDMLNDGWTVLAASALEYDGRGQMGVILQRPAPAPTSANGNGATVTIDRAKFHKAVECLHDIVDRVERSDGAGGAMVLLALHYLGVDDVRPAPVGPPSETETPDR